jgi:hypothetical protein
MPPKSGRGPYRVGLGAALLAVYHIASLFANKIRK